jgi:hypothetical protein
MRSRSPRYRRLGIAMLALTAALCAAPALAQEGTWSSTSASLQSVIEGSSSLRIAVDTAWVLFTACLVFWMNAGFAMVESGLCRAKNTTNILAKDFIVFAASSISFWVIGRLRCAQPDIARGVVRSGVIGPQEAACST